MLTEETMVLMVTIVNIEMRKAIIIVVANTTERKLKRLRIMTKRCPDCGSYNMDDDYCNECEGDGND